MQSGDNTSPLFLVIMTKVKIVLGFLFIEIDIVKGMWKNFNWSAALMRS